MAPKLYFGTEDMLQEIIDTVKFVVALVVIGGASYYWIKQGPPPRGRGRWRHVLKELTDRRRSR
jgi:hypothetical protein